MSNFTCTVCNKEKEIQTNGGTGYGMNAKDEKICYDCIAVLNKQTMDIDGHGSHLPLYLTTKGKREGKIWGRSVNFYIPTEVANWPGTLRFKVTGYSFSRHNFGCVRTDFWFVGPDKHVWHGYQIGDGNTIAHCKRTKVLA